MCGSTNGVDLGTLVPLGYFLQGHIFLLAANLKGFLFLVGLDTSCFPLFGVLLVDLEEDFFLPVYTDILLEGSRRCPPRTCGAA